MLALSPILVCFTAAAAAACMPASAWRQVRLLALVANLICFCLAFAMWSQFNPALPGFQFMLQTPWLPELNVHFKIGVDGISLTMTLLTALVGACGVLLSWDTDSRANEFYAFYLTLLGGVYGVFVSLDLFVLFVFYEIAIIPKYFLIAIWGGARKEYAAMKLVLYSFGSSAFVLLGLLLLYAHTSFHTLDMEFLMLVEKSPALFQIKVFPLLFFGFAVLAGMWPFHTWAPTGHVAAPTAASMLLAGVVMKLGAYGCLRAMEILPLGAAFWSGAIAWLAVIAIVYGALAALAQNDFKYVIGYSSVSHMGFVLLGLATLNLQGLTGAVLQMFSHGVIGALLFAIVGTVIYQRTHTRELDRLDRLIDRMPAIAWLFIAAGLASMGLPGFSGFIAELHVLLGVWRAPGISSFILFLAALGILLTFAYTLLKIHEAFFRKTPHHDAVPSHPYAPLSTPEILGCGVLLVTSLVVGLAPSFLLKVFEPAISQMERLLTLTAAY